MFISANQKVKEDINEVILHGLTSLNFMTVGTFMGMYSKNQRGIISSDDSFRIEFIEDDEYRIIFYFRNDDFSRAPERIKVQKKYRSWKSGRLLKMEIMDFIPITNSIDKITFKWLNISPLANEIASRMCNSMKRLHYQVKEIPM